MTYMKLLGCVVLGLLFSRVAAAATDTIFINVTECQITVADENPRPGCPTDAACRHAGEKVHWIVRPNSAFHINFKGAVPFSEGDTACLTGATPCTVAGPAGDYAYGVDVEGCPSLDPRIIIN